MLSTFATPVSLLIIGWHIFATFMTLRDSRIWASNRAYRFIAEAPSIPKRVFRSANKLFIPIFLCALIFDYSISRLALGKDKAILDAEIIIPIYAVVTVLISLVFLIRMKQIPKEGQIELLIARSFFLAEVFCFLLTISIWALALVLG